MKPKAESGKRKADVVHERVYIRGARHLFIDPVNQGEMEWRTFWADPDGRGRLVDADLPPRPSAAEAQADLDRYARKHRLAEVQPATDN
jgi:hypothetical protein